MENVADHVVEAPVMAHPLELFIGGRWVKPATDARITVVSPITEEIIAEVAAASEADVNAAVAAARRAFDDGPWPRTSPAERAEKMRAIARALDRRGAALAQAWTAQIGVPSWMSDRSAASTNSVLDYYAEIAEGYAFEDVRETGAPQSKVAIVVREPVGVVAAIAPWNGPLSTMLAKVAPALAAGCTIVAKPAPESPIEAFLLAEAIEEVGLPDGVFNLLPADRTVSDLLVRHPGIDKVSFTGSSAVGKHIASICASRMARYTMELGGKSAAIVLDDMDPAKLGPLLSPHVTMLSGQVCANFSRVLVPRRRADDYVQSLSAAMAATKVGHPFDPGVMMGPLAMERQLDRVQGYIAKGVSEGARIASGGNRPRDMNRGYYIEPTVFTDVDNNMVIAREEIFGPVAAVIAYDNEEDAIRIANDSEFGLSGGVFTNDTDRAYAVARRIRTGNFTQNGRSLDGRIPFGGFKSSGYGREGGPEGIEPYLEVKAVFLPGRPSHLA